MNGIKYGLGIHVWIDGSKFIGNFINNKAFGFCSFKNKNGNLFKGN